MKTVREWWTSRIGMPAMGLAGSLFAAGFTTSLAPNTIETSVALNSGLMSFISTSCS